METQPEPEPEPQPEENDIEARNQLIRDRLAEGVSVAQIAEEFGVSKSTVYNIRNAS